MSANRVADLLGVYGRGSAGRRLMAERISDLEDELARLRRVIDTPENEDFIKGVSIEAEHQLRRWPGADERKTPLEWAGLVLYLAGKAIRAVLEGDREKGKHHCISTAAALKNWHRRIAAQEAQAHG